MKKRILIFSIILLILISVKFLWLHSDIKEFSNAVTKSLGNKELKIGSNYNVWEDELGKPDIIAQGEYANHAIWLNKGIMTGVKEYQFGIKKIEYIAVPLKQNLPIEYLNDFKKIEPPVNNDSLQFKSILDIKFKDWDFSCIESGKFHKFFSGKLRKYDGSGNSYYDWYLPFVINKTGLKYACYNPKVKKLYRGTCINRTACIDTIYIYPLHIVYRIIYSILYGSIVFIIFPFISI